MTEIRFAKYHGTGNDFVMIEDLADARPLDAAFVAAVCDRRFGVGADGVIRVTGAKGADGAQGAGGGKSTEGADFFMDYWNADGTVALRCPGSAFLRAVVADAGGIVLSTSANAPGEPPRIRPEGAIAEGADLVVDQGALSGAPSTVVAIEGDVVRVLREGAVHLGGRRT